MGAIHIHDAYGGTHFELLMRDMEAFLLMAMQESIAVRKEERSSTEVRFSPFPSGLNLLGGKIMFLLEYILKSSCKNSEDLPVHGCTISTVHGTLKGKRYGRGVEIVTTCTAIPEGQEDNVDNVKPWYKTGVPATASWMSTTVPRHLSILIIFSQLPFIL